MRVASSNAMGGMLIQHFGYRASFPGLAAIALRSFILLWLTVPETRASAAGSRRDPNSSLTNQGEAFA
jgi:predicted MFS family arabinose efflux permease